MTEPYADIRRDVTPVTERRSARARISRMRDESSLTDEWVYGEYQNGDYDDVYDFAEQYLAPRFQKELGVSQKEAEEMAIAMMIYSGPAFHDIRAASDPQGNAEQWDKYGTNRKAAAALEKFIAKSPKYKGDTYRGMTVTPAQLEAFKRSKTMDMRGLSSWSRSESEAQGFLFANTRGDRSRTQPVIFKVKGKQPYGTSISHLTPNPQQQEVLVSGTARWKVTGWKDEIRIVDGRKTKVTVFSMSPII